MNGASQYVFLLKDCFKRAIQAKPVQRIAMCAGSRKAAAVVRLHGLRWWSKVTVFKERR